MTFLQDVLSLENLNKRLEERYILCQKHPNLPLRIYNYSPSAMFDNVWDHEIMLCRGLIVEDISNRVIARPFYKFFNLNTIGHPDTQEANLPKSIPLVTEKMDGSLGIYWCYGGEEGIATRGSFTSEQATWATNHLKEHYQNLLKPLAEQGLTTLFEIIYPENVIVVNYDFADLVMLTLVRISDGWEVPRGYLESLGGFHPPLVSKFDKPLSEIVKEDIHNKEGYVLSWHGTTIPLRVKVKFPEYLRLHKLLCGVSPKSLCKMLSEGLDPANDIGTGLPQPFIDWVQDWTTRFLREHDRIYKGAYKVYADFMNDRDTEFPVVRKKAAEAFLKFPEFKSICFLMLDMRPIKEQVWKQVWESMKAQIKEEDTFKKDVDQ